MPIHDDSQADSQEHLDPWFEDALSNWVACEMKFKRAKRLYDVAYGRALLQSKQPSTERREAEADEQTLELREAYECAEIESRAASHMIDHVKHRNGVKVQ